MTVTPELYATPTVAVLVGHLTVRGGGVTWGVVTIIEQPVETVLAAVPEESTTCAVKFSVPDTVGVPVIAPEVMSSFNGEIEPPVIE